MFRAAGRQPTELGWRAAFPDWQPAEERGDEAQLLPALRDGETARLSDARVEAKETRPPPRYNEGTLIDAMQNAWRFVADERLRDRLKQAKGIGTPATRGEVMRGLKAQEFLVADGRNIVPTERGLVLHGVLERADPALVDPGVTAQMEHLLDDVLVGRQDMMSAIDAVCEQASRIIGRLTEREGSDTVPVLPATTAAPNRLRHMPSSRSAIPDRLKAAGPRRRKKPAIGSRAASPATAGVNAKQRRPVRSVPSGAKASGSDRTRAVPKGRAPKAHPSRTDTDAGLSRQPTTDSGGEVSSEETPLRIPFGNKDAAQALGARYRAGGWYAPARVPLTAFRERGWL